MHHMTVAEFNRDDGKKEIFAGPSFEAIMAETDHGRGFCGGRRYRSYQLLTDLELQKLDELKRRRLLRAEQYYIGGGKECQLIGTL